MLTASPITNQPVGKTFTVAISVLGLGAALQLVLIGWAFVHRARSGAPPVLALNSQPLTPTIAHVAPAPVIAPNAPTASNAVDLTKENPFNEPAQVQITTPSSGVPPKPTPVTMNPAATTPANRFDELVIQGKELRERGDMNAAITKFREAAALDPKSAAPLGELALTYEKMTLADKANEHWKKVYEMGDRAGVYYALADAKLKASQANAYKEVLQHPPTADTPAPDTSVAIDGIAAGATLGLLKVTSENERDDNSAKRFVLHIPIKARPKAQIEVKDLVIHVLFYDSVEGQNVVQTSANVNSRWATPPADWRDTDTEELTVEYQLPKLEPRAAKRENRKYFGYIVRIYYKQQLQAATAEPERLAQQYPPPPTLPKENEK
jgi:tetratricopeptide (TPR) repeat protein